MQLKQPTTLLGPLLFYFSGLKQAPKIYLMVNEAYVSGEYRGHPVAAQLDIDVLR